MRVRGFTLIELMVVVTIAAILIAAAIPSFVWLNARTRAANASNALLASFELARSEAIRRNIRVSICRIQQDPGFGNAPVCSDAAVGAIPANDWATGWAVFAKTSGGVALDTVEGNDTVLRIETFAGPASPRVVMTSTGASQFYSFRGDGMSLGSGAPIGMTFGIDYRDPAIATVSAAGRCLAFNITGRATSYAPTAGVC